MGDTTQFNASGFKTNTDASAEDLLTKMPGVQVQDGKVNVQGEEVRRVLVDNKPFFGDDPNTALKNLPAEVIDKIQVFDQMSDQSRFTGFNDGNTTKTLNIITKAGMRNGNFGRAFAGGGTDDRYKAGFTLNRFQGNRRLTLLGQANNINEQNFSMADLAGVMSSSGGGGGGRRGGGGMGMMMGGAGGGRGGFNSPVQDFFVAGKKGIVDTRALGFNYSDNWGKKTEVSANYFFNQSSNRVLQNTFRTFVLAQDSGQAYSETSDTRTDNLNHRFSMRMEIKFDSANSLLYTPRFTYQDVKRTSNTLGFNELLERKVNSTDNDNTAAQSTYNLNNEFLLRHKFNKKGRTISLTTNLGHNGSNGYLNQNSENQILQGNLSTDTLLQKTDIDKNGWSWQNKLEYTEPLSQKGLLNVNYAYNYSYTASDRLTYSRNPLTGNPDVLNPQLSNAFVTENPSQSIGLGYGYNTAKVNMNINLNAQQADLDNRRDYPLSGRIERRFQNLLPFLMIRYNLSENKSVRLFYRTSANAPTVDQLQDVLNNSNPLQLSTGNANLRQDFAQNLFMRYMSTKTETNTSFFAMVGGSHTRHYIGTSTLLALRDTIADGIALNRGTQLSKPVNLDGYLSLRTFLMYSRPIKPLKTNLNVNANANYIRTPGLVNGSLNYARSPTFGMGLGFSSNISKDLDFNFNYNLSYTSVSNTLLSGQNNAYINHIWIGKINYVAWNRLVLSGEYNQNLFSGLNAGFNTNFTLLNLGMGYKFLKNRQAELRASVFDLLGQNTNISRTITETYTEDVRSNNLSRYFMLTFTYTLRAFKGPEPDPGRPQFHPGMMRPGVGPPPGMGPPQN